MLKSILFLAAFIVSSYAHAGVTGDIDGDGKIGLPEGIYALQSLAGLRPPLATAQAKVISKYIEFIGPTTTEVTLMAVPVGKMVVITDILILNGIRFWVKEDTSTKIFLDVEFSKEYHFNSGIPFSSGTNIIVKGSNLPNYIFFSGYEIDQ
jgi:hypothetical protein